ncbi:MAG: AmmeMemoRadiSam system protein A [Patescibacteria group bacterium]|nr:AmmeMemoRadiSam system protein A [Patescibacteria group bacterium]
MSIYVKLAQDAINEYVKNKKIISAPKKLAKEFSLRAGVFVSIHLKKTKPGEENLRGCIGTILPTKNNIAQEIIDNAIAACSRDDRFLPIKEDELKNLEISVDVLGEPESIEGATSLDPKRYGVIVKSEDGRTGLLLPNLPGINDPQYQIAIARQKAGILANEPIYLYRFEVKRYR